ncbi:MAG TPA: PQQ-binding-like beta-propeller repeat protein [Bacillota bacterium]|nr:PQQ-binding-like beta-propeller repeat protein [Bacillota bacterium]HPV12667.1 PQQ-binding-like beta-propeller repeat protein [Bacillota bacterium]
MYLNKAYAHKIKLLWIALLVMATVLASTTVSSGHPNHIPQKPGYLGNLSTSENQEKKASFKFIVAADSHLGSAQGNKNSRLAIEHMAAEHSDAAFMIHIGDITETGAKEEYDCFKNITAKLPFPILGTAGNHESRWQDPFAAKFATYLGYSNFSFDYMGWHFVVLDTTYPEQTYGTVDPSILSWLDADLSSIPKNTPVAIFSHHPIFYQANRFQDADDQFLDIIEKYPVQVLFCGHGHSFIPWKFQGKSCFMVGALMDNAYCVVEVSEKKMDVYAVKPGTNSNYIESLLGQVAARPVSSFKNPIRTLEATISDGKLLCRFSLSDPASLKFQIDDGIYNDLGNLETGTHQFSVDISCHAPGIHTLRLKATGNDGPYVKVAEFEKDTEDFVYWKTDLGSALTGRLLSDSCGRIIAGTRNGFVYCIDPQTGDILWQYDAGSSWCGGVINEEELYFGTASGDMCCLDKNNGTLVWKQHQDPEGFVEPPAVWRTTSQTLIYVGSPSGRVYALDADTKTTKWIYRATGAVTNTPSTGLGMIFFGAWDNTFYSLDAQTGQEIWKKKLGRQIYYSPAGNSLLHSGRVFTVTPADKHSGGSFLYALDPYDGSQIWKSVNFRTFLEPCVPLHSQSKLAASLRHILVPDTGGRITPYYVYDGYIPWRIQGYPTLFSGVPNLDGIYITGGSTGTIAIHIGTKQIDYKVRDTFLFTDSLVIKIEPQTKDSTGPYLVIQGDSRGTLWAIKIPD